MYASAFFSVSFLFLIIEATHTEATHTEASHTGASHTEASHTEASHTEASHTTIYSQTAFKVGDMVSVERQRRLDRWRRGDGVCYVCGHCLKSPFSSDGLLDSKDDAPSLSEICPIRLCLMRFNALADHQEAQILDNYTFLEGRRSTNTKFETELNKYYESHIRKLNPGAFEAFKLQYPAIFEAAVAIMQRTVASCTVPSCTVCNKAMVSPASAVRFLILTPRKNDTT